jgi:itaconyl-CoA hydratase
MDELNRLDYVRIGENRYREQKGFFYEDFVVGVVIEHRPGRTVTEVDNAWQSLLSMNQHPLHIDAEFARSTEFGRPLVSSLVTFSIVNGMTVHTISQQGVANLGWDAVRLLAPVFAGDTLYAESEILTKRPSKSRPAQGIVSVKTTGRNQNHEPVIEFERTIMVHRGQKS